MGWRLPHTVRDGWFGVVLYERNWKPSKDSHIGMPSPDVRQHVHAPALPPARKIRQRAPNGWEKIENDGRAFFPAFADLLGYESFRLTGNTKGEAGEKLRRIAEKVVAESHGVPVGKKGVWVAPSPHHAYGTGPDTRDWLLIKPGLRGLLRETYPFPIGMHAFWMEGGGLIPHDVFAFVARESGILPARLVGTDYDFKSASREWEQYERMRRLGRLDGEAKQRAPDP